MRSLCCLSDSTWLMHERNREVLSQVFRPNNNYECTCIFEVHLQGCVLYMYVYPTTSPGGSSSNMLVLTASLTAVG